MARDSDRKLVLASRLAGGFAAATGGAVLAGWAFDVAALRSMVPGLVEMKPNTALGLLAAGAALLLAHAGPRGRRAGRALAAGVAALGALTVSQSLLGARWGVDELLFADPRTPAGEFPGRQAPATSVAFALLGTALARLDARAWRGGALVQPFALAVGFTAFAVLVGHAYGAQPLYRIGRYSAVAVHTGAGLLALALGVLAARPRRGLAALLAAHSTGGLILRRQLPVVLAVPFAVGWVRAAGQEAGWYGTAVGTALAVAATVAAFGWLVVATGRKAHRLDLRRRAAEAVVARQRGELEERVAAAVRAEEELRQARTRAEALLASENVGTWDLDLVRDEVRADPGLARMYGLTPADAAGGSVAAYMDAVHPDDRSRVAEELARAMADGERYELEHRVTGAGTTYWVLARGRVERDPAGRPVRLPGVVVDITDRKRLEDELRAADRRKDEFLATLAHELRNPLAPIRNGLEVLRLGGGSGPVADRTRDMMDRQLVHLVRLVDDLLDVSRITRGKLKLRAERVDLRAILDAAVETARPAIDAAGHELAVAGPAGPAPLDGDPTRLAQVVANLLTNAAKYTPPGGHIRLSGVLKADGRGRPAGANPAEPKGEAARAGSSPVIDLDDAPAFVEIAVADDGVGIPPAMLGRVFEMFTQVDRALEKTTGGLGIGLSLVKGLVEMHGGTVEARSGGEGRGSEFVVRLPAVG